MNAEEKITAILGTISNVVWSISAADYKTLYLNPAAENVYGRPAADFYQDPELFMRIVHPGDRDMVAGILPELVEKGSVSIQYRIVRPGGEIRWLEDRIAVAMGPDGKPARFDGVASDITARLAAEERLNSILATITNVVWSISAVSYETLYLNPAAEKVYGRPAASFYADANLFSDIVHPEDRSMVAAILPDLVEKGAVTLEYRIVRPDGEFRWLEDRVAVGLGPDGKPARFDGVATDITERKAYEARVLHLATHDALTDLANRNLLNDRVTQAIARVHRSKQFFGLLLLDLDRFKYVNDTYGHDFGDALLLALALELRKTLRESDTLARLGGDEFVILLAAHESPEHIVPVVRRLLAVFARAVTVKDTDLYVTTSIGIAVYPDDGENADVLLKNADTAMYRAKELGRNGFQFFTPEMSARATKRLELENSLRQALERKEFELYYQPEIDVKSGRVIAVEALVRWRHPAQGIVACDNFIPLAEETGLILPLGAWVLKTACAQNKAWQDAGLPRVRMSVNVSAKQFWEAQIIKKVRGTLRETGLAPADLELEVTESVFLHDIDETVRTISELKTMGVSVSLDDFGTGYSSLNYLRRLPIEKLKIDKSFIHEMGAVPRVAALVKQIIQLAHAIDVQVVAEGVETAGELAFLADNQCDVAQGYHFHRPMPTVEFEKLLGQTGSDRYARSSL